MAGPTPIPRLAPSEASPRLAFSVEGAQTLRHAATPTIGFDLRIAREGGGAVQSVAMAVQVRIAATRRGYAEVEQERLADLFGAPGDWGRNLHGLLWSQESLVVPAFEDETVAQLPMACTYDLEVRAAKYLSALEDGEVPLEFLFTGTVFYPGPDDRLRAALIPWSSEAEHRLPVRVWRETMDHHFPGAAWLRLRREEFDRFAAYRARGAFPTWEAALDSLLESR
jgi:hypothetical protein